MDLLVLNISSISDRLITVGLGDSGLTSNEIVCLSSSLTIPVNTFPIISGNHLDRILRVNPMGGIEHFTQDAILVALPSLQNIGEFGPNRSSHAANLVALGAGRRLEDFLANLQGATSQAAGQFVP